MTFLKGKRALRSAIFLLVTAALFASCKKEDSDIGLGIQPEEDLLNAEVIDTFSLTTCTRIEDSLKTDELSRNMLGSYVDPVFGLTKASIYTQLRLSVVNPSFNGAVTVDSVVLQLVYDGHYGLVDPQTFLVMEVTETIDAAAEYYTNSDLQHEPSINDMGEPGANIGYEPDVNNYFFLPSGDSIAPHLRLRMEKTFWENVLNDPSLTADQNAFQNYFKGIYITTNNAQSSGQGGIYYLDLADAQSKLVVYYHDAGDTSFYDFNIGEEAARFTHVDHDYTGTPVEAQLNDSTKGQEFFYLQAGGGLVSDLYFPFLEELKKDSKVVINKAELYLPVQHYTIDPRTPPLRIFAFEIAGDGTYDITLDQIFSENYYSGFYDEEIKAYKFNLARHMQKVLEDETPNRGLRITAASSSVTVNRAIMSGQNSPNREKPYLKVTYTKYE